MLLTLPSEIRRFAIHSDRVDQGLLNNRLRNLVTLILERS